MEKPDISTKYQKTDFSELLPEGFPVRHKKKTKWNPKPRVLQGYYENLRFVKDSDRFLETSDVSEERKAERFMDSLADNIFWSVSIEGNKLSRNQVGSIISRAMGPEGIIPDTPEEIEVCNQIRFFTSSGVPELTEPSICGMHRRMLEGIDRFPDVGEYRRCELALVLKDGNECFLPCPKMHIAEEMKALNHWVQRSKMDTVSTAAVYFHEFESIHPFSDGNGRLGRILLHRMLEKEFGELGSVPYMKEFLGNRDSYYTLMSYTECGDYAPLMLHLSESLRDAYAEALEEL